LLALVGLWAITVSEVGSTESSPESPWRGSGIDFGFIDERLNNRACARTQHDFLSCVGAVQQILDVHGQDLHLIPVSDVTRSRPSLRVVERFGAAAVVEDRSLRVRSEGNALEVMRTRTHRMLRWRDPPARDLREEVDFSAMREWLHAKIIDQERREEFAAAAVNGYLGATDAHARIAPAGLAPGDPARSPGASSTGAPNKLVYNGVGAAIQPMLDAALVTAVLREGPAARASLRVHDFILAVDGASTMGLSTEELVGKLRGQRSTPVTLTVKRQDAILEVPIVRDAVTVENVVSSAFIDRGWQFAYLRIDSFLPPDTCVEVRRELDQRLRPTLNGLVLDLRDNTGGLIDQAVCVADLFLPEGEVVLEVREVGATDKPQPIRSRKPAQVRVPIVTLVNSITGSASEVLAGALQDHGRALIVGERTFGKGTVQKARPWQGRRSIMEFFTAARYYRPSGVGVQLIGIEPDIEVRERPGPETPGRIVLREGDLFPTALPREPEIWQHPNPERAAALRECADEDGLARHRLRRDEEQDRATDYPLAVAQDALVCQLTRRL
jgi:carboxyl-terminal processing protease